MSVLLTEIDNLILDENGRNGATDPRLKELVRVFSGVEYSLKLCLEIIQGFCAVLIDHSCRLVDVAARQLLNLFIDNSEKFCDPQTCISYMKYATALPLARYSMKGIVGDVAFCSLPSVPLNCKPMTFSGDFGRWFARRIAVVRGCNAHLWMSWFQVKRNTPIVDEEFVAACFEKHSKTLSSPDPCPTGLVTIFDAGGVPLEVDPLSFIEAEIASCAKAISQPLKELVTCRPKKSACIDASRASGGQKQAIIESIRRGHMYYGLSAVELVKMEFLPVSVSMTNSFNVVVSYYDCPDYFAYLSWFQGLNAFETLVEKGHEVAIATVCGVLEPLKVRTISRGSSLLYWSCVPYQKALHGCLKQMPVFRMIGREIRSCDLQSNSKRRFLASVDYSGATDGVSQRLGYRILNEICKRSTCPLTDWDRMLSAFGPHEIRYPPEYKLPRVQQTNGQLMGSIMSFPLLCLLNLITLRMAEATFGLAVDDPLINGDDMFYSTDSTYFWELQCQYAQLIGLSPSLGKCYLSTHCATMNSVLFTRHNKSMVQRDYFPVGLLHGKHKVAVADTTESSDQTPGLASCLSVVIRGSRKPRVSAARFLKYNKHALNDECKGRNIFVCEALGGMGILPPQGFRVEYTIAQLQLASRMLARLRENERLLLRPRTQPKNRNEKTLSLPVDEKNFTWLALMDEIEKDESDGRVRPNRKWPPLSRSRVKAFRGFHVIEQTCRSVGLCGLKDPKGCVEALNNSVPSEVVVVDGVEEDLRVSLLPGSYDPAVPHYIFT